MRRVYLVLSVDDTFNVSKYKMQFFDIIGVDVDGKTVMVAQALLAGKDTDSYRWVFKQLKQQLNGMVPSVIFSDGDLAIAAAIAAEFPDTQHCLCLWHWKGERGRGALVPGRVDTRIHVAVIHIFTILVRMYYR